MNESVKKWINGKSDKAVFTVNNISTGHKNHRSGVGSHDNSPKRERTRNAKFRKIMRDWQ
jgi:hypothetical protein